MDDHSGIEDEIARYVENGNAFAAVNLYRERLGEFRGIGWGLADYRLGLRLTERLVHAGGVTLEGMFSVRPWYDRSLYNLALGSLEQAEAQLKALDADLDQEREEIAALEHAVKANSLDDNWMERYENFMSKRNGLMAPGRITTALIDGFYRFALQQSLSDVMLAQGRLAEAERYAQQTVDAIASVCRSNSMAAETGASPYGRRAAARFLLGKVNEAWSDLYKADRYSPVPEQFGGMQRTYRLQLLIRQGKLETAARLLKSMDMEAVRAECPLLWANYTLSRAEIYLARADAEKARPLLERIVEWAEHTGHQETWIHAMLATARIRMQQGAASDAGIVLDNLQRVTRDKGFTIWLIECLILEGHQCLLLENLLRAEEATREAMALSSDSVTGYAWGMASASHARADVCFHEGRTEDARSFAQRACALRVSLGDARLTNSQALLDKIGV